MSKNLMNMKKCVCSVAILALAGLIDAPAASSADNVIYDATTANTTNFSNNNNGTTADNISVSGATPDLLLATSGGNFFSGGFASTADIDTLNGTALTAADTVTISATIGGISHTGTSELRSRGFEFGMSSDTSFDGGTADNLILKLGGGGNSGIVLMQNSFANFTETPFTIDPASMADGFGVTLTANETGFTYSFTSVTASSGTLVDLTGTFAAGEFVSNFGTGHFYTSVQKRLVGTSTLDFDLATIGVSSVPEPSSLALCFGLVGLALRNRRRVA